ncbi:MAG: hypothetical protein RL685_4530 [Pseudomonadota bacterium]
MSLRICTGMAEVCAGTLEQKAPGCQRKLAESQDNPVMAVPDRPAAATSTRPVALDHLSAHQIEERHAGVDVVNAQELCEHFPNTAGAVRPFSERKRHAKLDPYLPKKEISDRPVEEGNNSVRLPDVHQELLE